MQDKLPKTEAAWDFELNVFSSYTRQIRDILSAEEALCNEENCESCAQRRQHVAKLVKHANAWLDRDKPMALREFERTYTSAPQAQQKQSLNCKFCGEKLFTAAGTVFDASGNIVCSSNPDTSFPQHEIRPEGEKG